MFQDAGEEELNLFTMTGECDTSNSKPLSLSSAKPIALGYQNYREDTIARLEENVVWNVLQYLKNSGIADSMDDVLEAWSGVLRSGDSLDTTVAFLCIFADQARSMLTDVRRKATRNDGSMAWPVTWLHSLWKSWTGPLQEHCSAARQQLSRRTLHIRAGQRCTTAYRDYFHTTSVRVRTSHVRKLLMCYFQLMRCITYAFSSVAEEAARSL